MKPNLPVKNQLNIVNENTNSLVKVAILINTKKKYKPYEVITSDFKNIKRLMFNG